MNLYNQSISSIQAILEPPRSVTAPYRAEEAWPDLGTQGFLLRRDAAFELGGDGKKSVNCTCVTSTPGLVPENSVQIVGPDLQQIHGDVSFARIVLLEIEDPGEEQKAYDAIKNLEYVRYHVFPKGYLSRTSSESNREIVRVSKEAIREGISFEKIGNAYLRKYLEQDGVRHAKIIFAADFSRIDDLTKEAEKVSAITGTLSHILDNVTMTNCAECQLKPVCDSVEGLREMHMKQRQRDKERFQ